MSGSDQGISRRGLFAGMVAAGMGGVGVRPAGAPVDPVQRCARLLADAMAARHGGEWRIHVDHETLTAMVWHEHSGGPEQRL